MLFKTAIAPQEVEVFSPDSQSLGFFNEFELNDLRIRIAKEELLGYYVMFENEKIDIHSNGDLDRWPKGFFDLLQRQFVELFKLRKSKV